MNSPSNSDEQDILAPSMEFNMLSDSDIATNTSQELRKSEKTKKFEAVSTTADVTKQSKANELLAPIAGQKNTNMKQAA